MLRARDHVLRTGASLLRTSRVPGHLSTPVLGPLQDNLLRPIGYGLGLLRLELPCVGVIATLPRIQKSGHQLEGALVGSRLSPLVTSRETVMSKLPRVDRTGDTRASGRNCGIFNCWAKVIWATFFPAATCVRRLSNHLTQCWVCSWPLHWMQTWPNDQICWVEQARLTAWPLRYRFRALETASS
jgi:hypothetical protein